MLGLLRKYVRELLVYEKITREDFEDIEATARLAHMGQKRRDGTDYISHPLAVKSITEKHYPENYPAQILAMLHDTIEDGPAMGHVTEEELRDFIRGSISDPRDYIAIDRALEYMTHDKSIHPEYKDYLSHVFQNKLASIVKISDLIHNLSHNPSDRQIQKYKTALQSIKIPGHIQRSHLDELMSILEITR
tara:strand:+ start:589 stop:1161 length:573 start_codon:yes stop_codon:yes gene_type:complete